MKGGSGLSENNYYTTVEREASAEFEERRSLFIGYAKPVKSAEEAMEFVKQKKREHMDATHNVFAYLLEGGRVAKYSDDGEPQGTAGMPVLDTIRKSGVDGVCVVVTRYFGGILLGAGGLVRAYAHGAKIALEAANIITYEKYEVFSLNCGYSEYQKFLPLLSSYGALIDDTVFEADVKIVFAVKTGVADKLIPKISEISFGKYLPIKDGERFDYR
ncbi:MAG: YigZ family protein [Clostridia bacterium]|nr:YigZ family protein [Clostridia bacterium]